MPFDVVVDETTGFGGPEMTASRGRDAGSVALTESPQARDDHPTVPVDVPAPPSRDPVIPLRHPGRWMLTAVVAVIAAQIVHGLITNPFFQWDRFAYWFFRPVVIEGLWVTLEVAAYSAVLGLLGGIVLALMRLSRSPVLAAVSWIYVWVFRSIPLIVLLLILYNFGALYESLSLGIPFGPGFFHFSEADLATPLIIAIVGISLHESAFAAEIVRGGVLSVDAGQHDAAAALGLPRHYHFLRITLPQALRTIVPSYVNLLIGLIKATSLVYYVSLLDLFGVVSTQSSTYSGDVVPLLLVATVWYIVLTSIVSVAQFYVERYFARGAVRTLPPTPLQRLRMTAATLSRQSRWTS
ncbi:amino acid ABC transporter permease [Gordonia sp. VNQ95]|jgi:polar amino acid transport system permease protein|uniref:amino acid ABC transporter permease n=1 Tax=Gordonia TaxID=2053 RepID=UPI0032B3B832